MADAGPKKIDCQRLLERAPWDSTDLDFIKKIPMDDPAEHADILERQVVRGEAQAWRINHEGRPAGIAITKIDEACAKEFVICAMYSNAEYPLSVPVGRELERIARALGCVSIRFHTCRHALARAAAEMDGYRLTEVIMRKNLT